MNVDSSEEKRINIDEKYFENLEKGMIARNGIHVNPVLLRALGFNFPQAIILSQYEYISAGKNGKAFLYQDKNFLYSVGSMDKIMRAKKALKEKGLISVEVKGLPARSYIVFNHEAVEKLKKQHIVDAYFSIPEYLRPGYDEKTQNQVYGLSINCSMDNPQTPSNIYNKEINKDLSIRARESANPIQNFENSINRKSNYLEATVKQQNISSEAKEENKEPWEKYPAFMKLWNSTPEFSRGCGIQAAFNEWLIETENGTKNVEEIDKGLMFHFKTTPKDIKTKHLTKLLMYGTWKSFLFEANESEKKKRIVEESKKERKTKEEPEEKEYNNQESIAILYKEIMGIDLDQMDEQKKEKENDPYR